jgi:glucokinase
MVSVGIDIGGTNLAAGVVNEQFELLTKVKCRTSECPTAEAMVERLVRLSQEAVELAGLPLTDVRAVGVGIPGAVDREQGIVLESVNTPFHQTPFVDLFQSRWYVPVYLENDANCAVLGEGVAGSAKGARSVVAVTLGTGVGGGYLREGSLELYMRNGMEIGHTVIVPDGQPCPCGRRGCWEQYASATALKRMTREAMEAHRSSLMWELCGSPDKVKGRTAFDAKRAGDSAGTEVVERYLDYLDIGLSNLVNIFQPDLICIGGGVSHEKDEDFLVPLQERVDRHSLNKRLGNKTRLVTAALGGDAGILGAAALYREYIRR